MADIFLYHGETSPNDVKLRTPTAVPTSSKVAVPVIDLGIAPTGRTVYYQSLFIPLPPVVAAVVTATLSWLSPLSVPLSANTAASHVNQTDIYFTPTAANGWQSELSSAPPVANAQAGNSFVPFNTFQVNTATIDKWQSPLSIAVPVAKALPGNSFVPFDTAQTNTQRIDKWQVALSKPVPVAIPQQGNTFVPFNTLQTNTATIDKWQSPLSIAVPVARTVATWSFVPYNTLQANTQTVDKWQSPLTIAVPVARAQLGNSFVPFDTFQINTQRIDKWLVPLSKPVPVAVAQQGNSFVPFNTFQINTATVDKWLVPLSIAVPVARTVPTWTFVPFNTVQLLSYSILYLQPLSGAPAVATAQQGNFFVPFDTTQPQDIEGMAWWMPLGTVPLSVVYAPQQFTFEPPLVGEVTTTPAAATEDPLGDYSLIPLYRRKKLEDELEEIEIKLRDIALDIPLPGHSEPVIYDRPLLEPFSDKQQTISVLVSRRARAQAEYQALLKAQQDDDDDAAILLLWP